MSTLQAFRLESPFWGRFLTPPLSETALREKADSILNDTGRPALGKNATIAEVGLVFLYDKGRTGMVEDSTMEAYEQSVRRVVVPACGDLLRAP